MVEDALTGDDGSTTARGAISQNTWYRKYDGDAVIVFVHGIRSSCEACWRCQTADPAGKYPFWPDLLTHDERFDGFSIFLGGYYAELDASFLGIPQASIELYNALRRLEHGKPVLEFSTIIFICHSMGGIIVRNILANHADLFHDKAVGLILIASPSLGSSYADIAGSLIALYGNRLARQLKWNNDSLADLDTRFRELVDERTIPGLRGIEAYEHHFLVHWRWLPGLRPVVTKSSANRYFKEYPLPGTDHSSAARPNDFKHPSYQLVVDFLTHEMAMSLPIPGHPPTLLLPPAEEVVHPAQVRPRPRRKVLAVAIAALAVFVAMAAVLMRSAAGARRDAILAGFGRLWSGEPSESARGSPKDSVIGFSLWRMRLADSSAEVRIRGFRHREDPSGNLEWTPERLTLAQPVREGDEIRFSIEAAQAGYLYVIDRDVYADGASTPPTLIFPTARLRGGVNLVGAGHPVEIPAIDDHPPTLTVEKTRNDQTGILLTLILAPTPLAGVTVQADEQKLNEAQVSAWEARWGTQVERTEDGAMLGVLYTKAEKGAAADSGNALSDKDPLPVTLFRRFGHPGEPILAKALVKIGTQTSK